MEVTAAGRVLLFDYAVFGGQGNTSVCRGRTQIIIARGSVLCDLEQLYILDRSEHGILG